MAGYRLSTLARADLRNILSASEEYHGTKARIRYRALLSAAIRRVASYPAGRSTVDRADLGLGIRSFHIRHSRSESGEAPVANPVHVIFYREIGGRRVEIVRILHERMEPSQHIGSIQN